MICFRYIIVNTLHERDNRNDDDDDDDDDNNNNNNILLKVFEKLAVCFLSYST